MSRLDIMIILTKTKVIQTPLQPDLALKIGAHSSRLQTKEELHQDNRLTQTHHEVRTKTHGHLLLRRADREIHRSGSFEIRHIETSGTSYNGTRNASTAKSQTAKTQILNKQPLLSARGSRSVN